MKIRCKGCGRQYPLKGYGVMQPACPYCGKDCAFVIERRPGQKPQTHLCFETQLRDINLAS